MFGRNKNKATEQAEKKKSQAIFPKKAKATHPVSVQSTKTQKEYTYTLLPDKEKSKQKKIDKALVVSLKKGKIRKVDMENLFHFCQIDIKEALGPEYKLDCVASDQEIKKFKKDSLKAFYSFLRYWVDNIGFDKLKSMEGWTDDNFVKFCEEVSNLFDEFFLLPEKYKLLVRELAKAIYEKGKKFNNGKHNFKNMFVCLAHIVGFTSEPKYNIFNETNDNDGKTNDIASLLENEGLKKFWHEYCPSKEEFEAILNSINMPNDRKEIQNKLERLANSAFDKNPDSEKESFAERMKRVMEKFTFLKPADIESRNKDLWEKINKKLIRNDFFNIRVVVNCHNIPEKNISAVLGFFGITPQNRDILRLQKCNDVRVFGNPRIRRDLFVTMALSVCFNNSWDNPEILSDFFRQLTQEERFEVMHSNVQWRGQSFPLLLMFLLQDKLRNTTINLIRDFVPEVFGIRFKVDKETTSHNIIELLKEVRGFCDKRLKDENVMTEEERLFCENLLNSVGLAQPTIDRLEKIKKQHELKSKSEPKQKPKSEIERAPSTEIEVVSRRKYEISDCCLVNLFRCAAAKFR